MSKTALFAACAAALIVACIAGWAVPTSQARIATSTTTQLDPFTIMTSTTQLPTQHVADYSLVFN
jgi:hypothetical protein